MKARQAVRRLLRGGWYEVKSGSGSHRQFQHSVRLGEVIVPYSGKRDLPQGTLRSIERQSGVRLR
ncbi:MAG: type II toxin-antitoxin system HicA family toxin [Deltaproteobacteria bacterium]